MSIPFYILLKPLVYLVAVIVLWQTAKKNLDSRRRFAAIIVGLFVISVGLSVFESARPVEGVISIAGHQVSYAVTKGVLENLGLFAIVASLLMLLIKRLETARREVRQLARIAAGSADAIVGVDEAGRVTSWNRGAEMMFGYFANEMIGQKATRLVPRDAWGKCDAAIGRCREEGFVRGLSCRMIGKTAGKEMLVEITLSAITNEDGQPRGTSLFIRDVTQQKEMEKELLHASKQAAIGQLAASVVGEFGNLLTVISGKADLGAAAASVEETREAFADIRSCAGRARNVTNNLLACTGDQIPRKAPGRISDAVDAALSSMERQVEKAGVRVLRHYETVPETAFDRDQMIQVFENLLLNALRPLRQKGGEVDVSISSTRDYIEVSVTDNGPSISEEDFATLFEPFANTDNGQSQAGNTRLGLFVSREIVKHHSGNISVESAGHATIVRVHLPIVRAAHSKTAPGARPVPPKQRCRIAVVDADYMIRDLLEEALTRKDFEVRTFADPPSAKAANVGDEFDVALVDVSVRTRDGKRYIEHLKINHDISIIAIVGEAMGADDLAPIEKGLTAVLHKPFGLDEVSALCESITPHDDQEPDTSLTPNAAA